MPFIIAGIVIAVGLAMLVVGLALVSGSMNRKRENDEQYKK